MKNIAIFASGSGSNFEAIAAACKSGELNARISLLVCDRPKAKAIIRAEKYKIPVFSFRPKEFSSKAEFEALILAELEKADAELIALAGYMRLIGETLLSAYPGRIVNIHPSLLPAFPGKGTDAIAGALASGSNETGVTIHYVEAGEVDMGPIVAQCRVPIFPGDTFEALEERIHKAEHELYVQTLKGLVEYETINVGILVPEQIKSFPGRGKIYERTLRNVYENAKNYGVNLFSFTPNDVNLNTKTIAGTFLDENGSAVQKEVPYPLVIDNVGILTGDVIYDDLAKHAELTRPFVTFNKLERLSVIPKDGDFGDILIPSMCAASLPEIEGAFCKFDNNIILKPLGGSFGQGILMIYRDENCYVRDSNKGRFQYSCSEFKRFFELNLKNTPFIVQQIRESKTLKNQPFDIRIFAKRGKNGKFLTFMYVKVGKPGKATITFDDEISGVTEDIGAFLRANFEGFAVRIEKDLNCIAQNFPEYYQSFFKEMFFNLGLDLGIERTENGYRINLFEVNTFLVEARANSPNAEACLGYYRYLHEQRIKMRRMEAVK